MRKRVCIAFVLVAIATIAFGAYKLSQNHEPRYRGRPLRDCILDEWNMGNWGWTSAAEAVRACGTNAIPYYLKLIQTKPDSPLKIKLFDFLAKHNWPQFGFIRNSAEQNRTIGGIGLSLLGSQAHAAVPALTRIAMDTTKDQFREAGLSLTCIGTDGVGILTNILGNPNAKERWWAAELAGNYAIPRWYDPNQPRPPEEIESAAGVLVPFLISGLADADRRVKVESIQSLGNFARAPETVVPILVRMFENTTNDPYLKARIMFAFRSYGSQASNAAPALLNELNDRNGRLCRPAGGLLITLDKSFTPAVVARFTEILQDTGRPLDLDLYSSILDDLGRMGKEAEAATPALLTLIQNPNARLSKAASRALVIIDPDAAANAGVDFTGVFTLVSGDDRTTLIAAIQALGESTAPTKGSVSVLLRALKSRDARVRHEAGAALRAIAPGEAAKAGVE